MRGGSSVHHPCVSLERHLLKSGNQASLIPRRRLSWCLGRGERRVSLRSGTKNTLTAALEFTSYTTTPTLRTLGSPRVDADPWAARVRRARWLLLLAAVGPPAPTATLLLWRTLLLLLIGAWLHHGGRGRRRLAGGTAPSRRRGDQSGGGGHLGLICQAQLLEGEEIDGLDEGHARLACDDFSSGAVARISAARRASTISESATALSTSRSASAAFFRAWAYSWTDISP